MGIVISPVNEIDQLLFHKTPTNRPVNIVKLFKSGNITILVGKNGKLYCDRLADHAFIPSDWNWNDSVLKGLVKLKIITQEAMDKHIAHCNKVALMKEKQYAKKELERLANKFNFKITDEQLNILT